MNIKHQLKHIISYLYPYEVKNILSIFNISNKKELFDQYKKDKYLYFLLDKYIAIYIHIIFNNIESVYKSYDYSKLVPIIEGKLKINKIEPKYNCSSDDLQIMINYINNIKLDNNIFKFLPYKRIKLANLSGFNVDYRSFVYDLKMMGFNHERECDYINYKVPFHLQIQNHYTDTNITLKKFIEMFISLKSGKRDFQCEMLSQIDVTSSNEIIKINVKFI